MTAVMHSKHHTLAMPIRRLRSGCSRGSNGVSGGVAVDPARSDARRHGVDRITETSASNNSQVGDNCLAFAPELAASFIAEAPMPSARERMARIVKTIEHDIIPRLVQAHRPDIAAAAMPLVTTPRLVTTGDVLAFVQQVLAPDDGQWQALTERLLAEGMAVGDLYLHLLAPAAQELGRMWDEDLCSFTDVTVAVGRMQRVLRSLSPAFGHEVDHPQNGRRVLLVPAPGEQHTLGLAIVADIQGEPSRAFDGLADARRRCRRLADPYVWLDAYILDAQCELGRRHDHPDVTTWTDTLRELASRTGMKEMTVRSLLHGAALGRENDAEAATLLAADLDNPILTAG